tara:strand:+ start:332 stop:868 length:537 start_codon:yes stop_codon:yes gene_type:complete
MQARDAVLISTFTALIAVLGMIPPIPITLIPVPITFQTLGVILTGLLLKPKNAALSVLIFLILVAIGMPLLSGGRGGLGVFLGPSSGFLISWIIAAYTISHIRNHLGVSLISCIISSTIGGILLMYPIGIFFMSIVTGLALESAFFASLVFIPGDIFKVIIASMISTPVLRAYPSNLS